MNIPKLHETVSVCIYYSVPNEDTIRFSQEKRWEEWTDTFQKIPDLPEWLQNRGKDGSKRKIIIDSQNSIEVTSTTSHATVSMKRIRVEMTGNYKLHEALLIAAGWKEVDVDLLSHKSRVKNEAA